MRRGLLIAVLAAASASADANGAATSDTRRRDEELPKVLYVVPWKEVEVERIIPPLTIHTDEVLAPLDREVVRRRLSPGRSQAPAGVTNGSSDLP